MPVSSNGIQIDVLTTESGSDAAAREVEKVSQGTQQLSLNAQTLSDSLDKSSASVDDFNRFLLKSAETAGLDATQILNLAKGTGAYSQTQMQAAVAMANAEAKAKELAAAVASGKMTAQQAGEEFKRWSETNKVVGQSLDGVTNSVKKTSLSFTDFRSAYLIAQDVMRTGEQIWNATAGEAVKYGEELEKVRRLTGLTAEESSRLVQTADDLFVSESALNSALTIAGKKYDLSINGIAKMADEYNALGSTVDKNAYAQQRFGRNYSEVIKLLEAGGDKIKQIAANQPTGLIFNQQNLNAITIYKQQVDQLNDSMQALKLTIGTQLIGIVTGSTVEITKNAQAIFEAANGYNYNANMAGRYTDAQRAAWQEAMRQAESAYAAAHGLDAQSESAEAAAQSAAEMAAAVEKTSQANTNMLGLIMQLQTETDSYNEKNQALVDKLAQLTAEQSNFTQGSKEWDDYQAKIDEVGGSIEDLAAKHEEAGKRIAFSLLQSKLAADGFTDAEFTGLLKIGEQWGILDATTVAAAESMNTSMNQIASGFENTTFQGKGAYNTVKRFGESALDAESKLSPLVSDLSVATDQLFVAKTLQGTYNYTFKLTTIGDIPTFPSGGGSNNNRKHGGEFLAEGTEGWKTVPSGYPNDTYPIGLTSGEKYAVIPQGGSMPAGGGGGAMGSNINITISSFLSLADMRDAEYKLTPIIERAIRNAQGLV